MKKNVLDEVLAFAEAAEKWGLGESTLRSTVNTNKLKERIDYRKSGKVWLITKEAMRREYGKPDIPEIGFCKDDEIFKEIQDTLNSNGVKYSIHKNDSIEEEFYINIPFNQSEFGIDPEIVKQTISDLKNNSEYNESFQMYKNKKSTCLIVTYLQEFI